MAVNTVAFSRGLRGIPQQRPRGEDPRLTMARTLAGGGTFSTPVAGFAHGLARLGEAGLRGYFANTLMKKVKAEEDAETAAYAKALQLGLEGAAAKPWVNPDTGDVAPNQREVGGVPGMIQGLLNNGNPQAMQLATALKMERIMQPPLSPRDAAFAKMTDDEQARALGGAAPAPVAPGPVKYTDDNGREQTGYFKPNAKGDGWVIQPIGGPKAAAPLSPQDKAFENLTDDQKARALGALVDEPSARDKAFDQLTDDQKARALGAVSADSERDKAFGELTDTQKARALGALAGEPSARDKAFEELTDDQKARALGAVKDVSPRDAAFEKLTDVQKARALGALKDDPSARDKAFGELTDDQKIRALGAAEDTPSARDAAFNRLTDDQQARALGALEDEPSARDKAFGELTAEQKIRALGAAAPVPQIVQLQAALANAEAEGDEQSATEIKANIDRLGASEGFDPREYENITFDAQPPPSIAEGIDYTKGVGPSGFWGGLFNKVSGAVGGENIAPLQEEAAVALENIAVRTQWAFRPTGFRPTNFLMEQIQKLTVQGQSLLAGDDTSGKKIKQTLSFINSELGKIDNNILDRPQLFSRTPQILSDAILNRGELMQLKSDYEAVLSSFYGPSDGGDGGLSADDEALIRKYTDGGG